MDKAIIKKVKKVLPRVLIILGGVILIIAILLGGIKANDYLQVNKLVKASDSLTKQEKYQDAYNSLTLTQARWTTSKVKKEIETKLIITKQLVTDQSTYNQATDLFGQSKWQEAKDSYSKVSDKFIHYKEAQDKIKECQTKIDEANAQAEKDKQAEAQKAKRLSTPVAKPATIDTQNPPSNSQNQVDYNNCVQKVIALYDITQKKFLDLLNDSYLGCGVNSTCRAEAFAGYNVYKATLETANNNNLTKCAAQYPH